MIQIKSLLKMYAYILRDEWAKIIASYEVKPFLHNEHDHDRSQTRSEQLKKKFIIAEKIHKNLSVIDSTSISNFNFK